MSEIGFEFVAVEAAEVVPDDEALAQGFVDGHGEPAPEFGESDEDQAQSLFGVHGEVGEQAEVFEHVVAQVLGLVDDEHRQLFGFGDESGDLVADGAVGGGSRAFGGQAEFPGDGLVHVEHVAGGERDVVDAVEAGMQGGGDCPAGGGFAGADLAGQQADTAQVDEVVDVATNRAGVPTTKAVGRVNGGKKQDTSASF